MRQEKYKRRLRKRKIKEDPPNRPLLGGSGKFQKFNSATDSITEGIQTRSKSNGNLYHSASPLRKISQAKGGFIKKPKLRSLSAYRICDGILGQSQGAEEDNVEDFDRIQTSVDPFEEEEFLDSDVSDKEDGELEDEGESDICESEADEYSTGDSEIRFKRPSTIDFVADVTEHPVAEQQQFEHLRGNVAFESYIKAMVAKELQEERKKVDKQPCRVVIRKETQAPVQPVVTPPRQDSKGTPKRTGIVANNVVDMVKSPSDTTIYAPALQRALTDNDPTRQIVQRILTDKTVSGSDNNNSTQNMGEATEQIINFIEGVRLEARTKVVSRDSPSVKRGPPVEPQPGTSEEHHNDEMDPYKEHIDVAKQKANQMILDAERFKATVNVPPGEDLVNSANSYDERMILNDDDFFHVTCHVDPVLRAKIEKGEFVDLERLLPKQRSSFGSDDNRMNLMHKDGQVFFVPATSGNRIGNIRKWEQAFRIYAAIYSQANPSRAAEIWQYVHTINVAATGYIWENVSYYDITFRHLMSQNPSRSWSKIYNQMWNMALRDVIPRNNYQFGNGQNTGGRKSGSFGQKKPKYCWTHNRGAVCKDGPSKCRFVHRCSYCDNADHVKSNCPTNPKKTTTTT